VDFTNVINHLRRLKKIRILAGLNIDKKTFQIIETLLTGTVFQSYCFSKRCFNEYTEGSNIIRIPDKIKSHE